MDNQNLLNLIFQHLLDFNLVLNMNNIALTQARCHALGNINYKKIKFEPNVCVYSNGSLIASNDKILKIIDKADKSHSLPFKIENVVKLGELVFCFDSTKCVAIIGGKIGAILSHPLNQIKTSKLEQFRDGFLAGSENVLKYCEYKNAEIFSSYEKTGRGIRDYRIFNGYILLMYPFWDRIDILRSDFQIILHLTSSVYPPKYFLKHVIENSLTIGKQHTKEAKWTKTYVTTTDDDNFLEIKTTDDGLCFYDGDKRLPLRIPRIFITGKKIEKIYVSSHKIYLMMEKELLMVSTS
jgi:hypothetical protein